jgi:hypothetical protein
MAEDELPPRSQSHAQRDLVRPIGRPRREEAAEVGTSGKQDEDR